MIRLKNLLHLVWTLDLAGAERVALTLAEASRREGFCPHVCALSPSRQDSSVAWRKSEVVFHEVAKKDGLDSGLAFRIRSLLKEMRAVVFHTHNAVGGFYGALACRGLPLLHVHTEHSHLGDDRRMLARANAFLLRSAALVADSRFVASVLIRRDGWPKDRVNLIYNGVDIPEPDPAASGEVRSELKIPSSSRIVGTVGNLRPVKDHVSLIEAFSIVCKSVPDVHLVILGEGSERPSLEALIVERGLAGRVHLCGFRDEARRWVRAFDVFVLSSVREGFPLSLLEAMAAGVPCIATSVGGIPEVIEDSRSGLLVPPRSLETLARSIGRLLASPEEARHLGERGRERVSADFSRGEMVLRYMELYGRGA